MKGRKNERVKCEWKQSKMEKVQKLTEKEKLKVAMGMIMRVKKKWK